MSWTGYHLESYRQRLPEVASMRHPLDVLEDFRSRGFPMTVVSMDGSGDKNLGLFPTLRGKKIMEAVPPAAEWFSGCDGTNSLTIWTDGKAFTCPPLTNVAPYRLGNIHTDSLEDILRRRPEAVKSPQCAVCRENEP